MLTILEVETASNTVLFMNGELIWENSQTFSDKIHSAAEKRDRQVILDMHSVHFIDSSGIGTLLSIKNEFEKKGKRLRIRYVSPLLKLSMLQFLNIEN